MFPPDKLATTGPSKESGSSKIAATAAMPPASTCSLLRSKVTRSARASEASLTVRISSTCSWIILNGTTPGLPTAIPSAIVAIRGNICGEPAASDGG